MDSAWKVALATHILLVITMDAYVSAECNNLVRRVPTFLQCQYRCHCKNDDRCDQDTGHCTYGCDHGWMGPGCQYRNIAIYSTDKGMTAARYLSLNSVDGDKKTCSRSGVRQDRRHTWYTQFDQMYEVIGLKITVLPHETGASMKVMCNRLGS